MKIKDTETRIPVPDRKAEECPTSAMWRFPEMVMMVDAVLNDKTVAKSTGSVLYGPDSSSWPSRWYDAVRISQIEEWVVDEEIDRVRRLSNNA